MKELTKQDKQVFNVAVEKLQKSLKKFKQEIPAAVKRQVEAQRNAKLRSPSADAW